MRKNFAGSATLLGLALSIAPAALHAQTPDAFFAGKTISFIVGAGAGGSYDLYARALANHMPRYIPGKPQMIVKIAGGVGGGLGTAISVEHTAPKDGTTIGMTQQTNVTAQLTEEAVKGKFDISKWRWIGNMAPLRNFIGVWHTSKAQSLEDAKTTEIIVGATGRNSPTFIVPQAINEMMGAKFKFVLGYNGVADLNLAMERGEIQARGGAWLSVVTTTPAYISEKKLKALAVDGVTREPSLPDVPTLLDIASTPEQKAAAGVISGSSEFARAAFLPPGVPQDRVDILRRAFDATMKDAEFLAEAAKLQLVIEPRNGAALDKLAAEIVKTPASAIALAKKLLGE